MTYKGWYAIKSKQPTNQPSNQQGHGAVHKAFGWKHPRNVGEHIDRNIVNIIKKVKTLKDKSILWIIINNRTLNLIDWLFQLYRDNSVVWS